MIVALGEVEAGYLDSDSMQMIHSVVVVDSGKD